MKTYKETIESPKLVIEYDDDMESPRGWDGNLGYFITVDSRMSSPDRHEQLENIVRASGDEAQNQEDHIQIMSNLINTETAEQVIAIFPITKYEHSGVAYRLGNASGFDYSQNGFYIITDKTQKESGVKKKDFEKVIGEELKLYNQWLNGEIYRFRLYDDNGEIADSCGGFFDIEDIRESLPEEWKDENLGDYIKN